MTQPEPKTVRETEPSIRETEPNTGAKPGLKASSKSESEPKSDRRTNSKSEPKSAPRLDLGADARIDPTGRGESPGKADAKMSKGPRPHDPRADRLAAALRANLARRKAAKREQDQDVDTEDDGGGAG